MSFKRKECQCLASFPLVFLKVKVIKSLRNVIFMLLYFCLNLFLSSRTSAPSLISSFLCFLPLFIFIFPFIFQRVSYVYIFILLPLLFLLLLTSFSYLTFLSNHTTPLLQCLFSVTLITCLSNFQLLHH